MLIVDGEPRRSGVRIPRAEPWSSPGIRIGESADLPYDCLRSTSRTADLARAQYLLHRPRLIFNTRAISCRLTPWPASSKMVAR